MKEGLFFGFFFFFLFFLAPFCFSAGKKERSHAYVERAGPQAPKGLLDCKTLSPKEILHCKTLSPKRSAGLQRRKALKRNAGLQHPKPSKECWVAKP